MAFRIGQKVCCVDATPRSEFRRPGVEYHEGMDGLAEQAVYTIRGLYTDDFDGRPAVWLEEIVRDYSRLFGREQGFDASRFRPVTEQKRETSISIFKEILDRENHGLPSRVDYPADCEPK